MRFTSKYNPNLRSLFIPNFELLFVPPLAFFASVIATLFWESPAVAFPELVRHNYANCTACHVNPSGGGVLTQYGRGLSSAVLSTWGEEKEGMFAYGIMKPPDWLELGGDLRLLNISQQTAPTSSARTRMVLMQADVEAAITYKIFTAVGTAGIQDAALYPDNRFISRRHYGLFYFSDELSLRAGRFLQAYGINIADHPSVTRRDLGLDQGQETYNVELAWLGEKWNAYTTGIFSRPDIAEEIREKGVSTSLSYFFLDRFRVGANYFFGTSHTANRHVFGPFFILGFTPRLFLLSEVDLQRNFARTFREPQWGAAVYQRLNYEMVQGLHVFLTQQYSKLNFAKDSTRKEVYGLGIQFFPRPHLEFELVGEKRCAVAVSNDFSEWVYLLTHFYL